MPSKALPTISTDRLTLRAFQEADAQDVFDACSNPILGHDAGWPPHQTIEDSLFYINEIAPLGYVWAITVTSDDGEKPQTDRVIGSIGLLGDPRTPEDETTMMLGYWLAEDQWNQGFTTEASQAVIAWAFQEAGLNRITTSHYLFNNASRRVIEKCGFEKREIAPFPSDDPNEPDQDVQWYELLRA